MSSVICLPACSPGPLLPSATRPGRRAGACVPRRDCTDLAAPDASPGPRGRPARLRECRKARLVQSRAADVRSAVLTAPAGNRVTAIREAAMRSLALPLDGTAGIRLVLYFTKGLGDVVAAEVSGIVPAAAIQLAGDRFLVLAVTAAEAARLGRQARTVDDARLLVAGPERIGSEAGFAALCAAAAARVREVLPPDGGHLSGPWSVTVSARSPVWRRSAGWDPAPVLARHFPGADLSATERSPVDLRLQADEDTAHVALNLWSRPIGKRAGDVPGRAGDVPGRAGALRPTVAAA